jgi:hypothetical protein
MAGTVTSELTNITLAEAGDSAAWDDISGGPGSSNLDDLPVQGTEHRGRRIDNTTARGFGFDATTPIDLSGAGTHLAFWANVLQPGLINTTIEFSLSDSASDCQSGNWDGHQFQGTDYPFQGGWIRVFVDLSRTRDAGSGTLNLATGPRNIGARFPMGDVGGTTPNCHLDRIDYTTAGLLIDAGTAPSPATFDDLDTADGGNSSNRYGVIERRGGIDFVNARITIADATATVFNDTPNVVFADQPLAASDFQGITVDLQNASTDVDFVGGSVASAPGGTNQGDLVVTGTSGAFDATGTSLTRLRVVTLTSACAVTDAIITECGLITAAGADLSGSSVLASTGAVSVGWDVATDTDGLLDGMTFESDGSNHAIELGTNTPSTISINDWTVTNYAAVDGSTGNEAIYNNSAKAITINVSGASGTLSVRNGTSASTVLVINPVALSVTCLDADTPVQNVYVLIWCTGTGPFPSEASVTITRSGSTASVAHTGHGLSNGDEVRIDGPDQPEYRGVFAISNVTTNAYDYTVDGTPATPATGTITASLVLLNGLTNASGVISDTRSYASDQDITGRATKGTSSPVYIPGSITGTVNSTAGLPVTVPLVADE